MINDSVIKEIYKKFSKPHKHESDLRLDYYIPMLSQHHTIENDGFEIVLKDVDPNSPFHRFLIRSLNAVLEFDTYIAFVFKSHILFFGKEDNQLRINFHPEKKPSIFDRIFRRK